MRRPKLILDNRDSLYDSKQPPHVKNQEFIASWGQPLLDALRSLQAPSGDGRHCGKCQEDVQPLYRCRQCFRPPLLCQHCILSTHSQSPLHLIDKWNGHHFSKETLANLGLILHVGHPGSEPCPNTKDTIDTTVVHCNGVQSCRIQYCGCLMDSGAPRPQEHSLQLMLAGLFPASFKRPRTVFTLELFREFRHLSHHAKTNARDFMASKVRMTNNVFQEEVTVSPTQYNDCSRRSYCT